MDFKCPVCGSTIELQVIEEPKQAKPIWWRLAAKFWLLAIPALLVGTLLLWSGNELGGVLVLGICLCFVLMLVLYR